MMKKRALLSLGLSSFFIILSSLIIPGVITLQQAFGSTFTSIIIAHNITPVMAGVISMIMGLAFLFLGFFSIIKEISMNNTFVPATFPKKKKKVKTLRQKIMLILRIILIVAGIISLYSYLQGSTPLNISLPLAGSTFALSAIAERFGRALIELFSIIRNIGMLQK